MPTALAVTLMGLAGLALLWLWRRQRRLLRVQAELRRRLAAAQAELQRLQQAHDVAEATAHARARFFAAASHDLRQPAHALALYTSVLRAGPLEPAQADVAARIGTAVDALGTMFDALLDVARIDGGAVTPQWDGVPLAPLLHALADEFAPQASARGLRLAVRVSDPDAAALTDAVLLQRLLRNLLANAVKFTVHGGVLLACRRRGAHLRVEVWDSGPGIAMHEQERVFEEFMQLGAGERRRGGLGLGLAIVRRLAQLLQLQVQLHSRPGHGSVFFVEGLQPAAGRLQEAAAARLQLHRLAGRRVVVIDDDAEVRDASCRLLRLWHCEPVAGADADDVLRQLPSQPPAAVVADVHLADGKRGPDQARLLFEAWGRSVPLLLISGHGNDGQLRKPVSPARLRSWLEQAVAEQELDP